MNLNYWPEIKDYLPVIVVLISAVIAFVSNNRHKDLDRFYKNAEENLYNLIEPMYYKMEKIEKISDEIHKLEAIRNYFNTYNPENINISKLGNRQLIDKFLDSHTAFHHYLTEIDDKNLRTLFRKFRSLRFSLEKEYWNLFETIYKDYNWFKKSVGMNYLFRFFVRITVFFERTMYAVTWILFGFLGFIIIDEYNPGGTLFDENLGDKLEFSFLLFFFSLILLYLSMFINLAVADDTKQKKTFSDYASVGLTNLWKKTLIKKRDREEERGTVEQTEEHDQS